MHVAETSFTSASVENLSQMNLDTVTTKIAFCPAAFLILLHLPKILVNLKIIIPTTLLERKSMRISEVSCKPLSTNHLHVY